MVFCKGRAALWRRTIRRGPGRLGQAALAVVLAGISAGAAIPPTLASAETVTYSAKATIPVPPASKFGGSGGGDGWAVALSENDVYNVFHHSKTLQFACHLQSTAAQCYSPETITDVERHNFSTSGQPGLYFDQATGKLYVYATRVSDGTAGVVCINTTIATTDSDPYCGFVPLTKSGESPLTPGGISGTSDPMLVGTRWYAFNFVTGAGHLRGENSMLCFDVSTDQPCAGQPYAVALGEGTVAGNGFPSPATAAIGSQLIVPLEIGGLDRLACFDTTTEATCSGAWPVTLKATTYVGHNGAPVPLLEAGGSVLGLCLPTGSDECFTLQGRETATPTGLPAVLEASTNWNGPAVTIGPRIYVPNGEGSGEVECFDYSTAAACPHFPKSPEGLGGLYTVDPDPQRPTCIWVNSDHGEHQIQNFDAYTAEGCGQGTIRALTTQFAVAKSECDPVSYVSVQVLKPARSTYASGSVSFQNGDGAPIGLPSQPFDSTGTAALAGLELNGPTGLPEFLFAFSGLTGTLGTVEVQLNWTGPYNAHCITSKVTVTKPTTTVTKTETPKTTTKTPPPKTPTKTPAKSTTKKPAAPASCKKAALELVDVSVHGARVKLNGQAAPSLAGSHIQIRFLGTGATVAGAVVGRNGSFQARAPLPPARMRRTNLARYEAVSGKLKSMPLKLFRRMYLTKAQAAGTGLLLSGRVAGSFRAGTAVLIHERLACAKEVVLAKTVLSAKGTFSATVPLSNGGSTERTYRASTTVLWNGRPELTYTLPVPAPSG
jgi:hypothetical protein